jgi:CheY-like chemotaxis protein/anti-sigma regulatory factor (Ser/Thr protein kinase)
VDDERLKLLIVDDNPGDVQLARIHLKDQDLDTEIAEAHDGVEGLEHLRRAGPNLPDVVVTDLHMPRMDGLALVEAIRREFPAVPVVLMTAFGSEEIAFRSLQRGAASYVPKRDLREALARTLRQMADLSRTQRQDERLHGILTVTETTYAVENDITLIPPLVRQLGLSYRKMLQADETDQFRLTVALHEALSNAIYHGNLEVGTELRRASLEDDAFYRVAEERRKQPPWCDRRVLLTARISRDEAAFVVRDEGPGFNPATLPDPRDRSNLEKVGGRGVLLIRMFMDEVRHNRAGNEITLIKRRAPVPAS